MSKHKQTDPLMTRSDIQARLQVSRGVASQLILAGAFPNASKVGRQWRVPASDIDAYLAKNRVQQKQSA